MSSEHTPVADFYIGRGPKAQYLGSVWGEVSPDQLQAFTWFQGTEDALYDAAKFQADLIELMDMAQRIGQRTQDANRWPHTYRTSNGSDFAYCYDAASVHVYESGFQVATILCNGARKEAEFPRFAPSARKD